MSDRERPYRAAVTPSRYWKVEKNIGGCSHCNSPERWVTILYTYQQLAYQEQEEIARSVAALLNQEFAS